MKKLFPLILLCLGILSEARAQTCTTTITSYPYVENFDGATAPGWNSGGTFSSWALGTPAKTVINSAASGTKSWVTSLTGPYNAMENSYVESPCFNMSTLIQPVVEMKIWWNTEFSYDGAVLQSSIDGGTTWQKVGTKGDPNNWYNDNSINAGPGGQPAATAEGWSGRVSTLNGSGGWVTARHLLTGLGGQANVKLRIAFAADNVVFDNGFAFDDFRVYDTPANDAGVTSIAAPVSPITPLISTPINVTVKNFGTSPLTAATFGYSVNGIVQPTFAWTGNVAQNAISAPIQIGTFAFPAGIQTIKAWSKLPNNATDGNSINDTSSVTLYACNPLTGNYTINKGAGATATNFTSFASAAQALTSCGVGGPVIFTVVSGSGTYNEVFNLTNISGTSATNTVTFNGNGNTISGTPATADDGVIKLDGTKFCRFNNLTIVNQKTTGTSSAVLLINTANNNIFNGCTINTNITATAISYGANISIGSHSNSFQNNTINGGYYGVYNYGTYNLIMNNNQFTGNILKDQYSYGLYFSYSTNLLVENNDISRPTRTNVTSFYGIYMSYGVTGAVISKNRVHNSHDAATVTSSSVYGVYNVSPATPGNENIIKNNVIYNINNTNGFYYGLYNATASGAHYYHNTVVSNPAITYNTIRGMTFSSATTNLKFINNIISIPSAASNKYAIHLDNATIALISNNNDLYIGTTGNTGHFSGDKATLADWKAANANAYDQNSIAVDPVFVNPASILQPNSNAVNNTGQPLTTVNDDINGIVRSTTSPDPGAYEFTPATTDASISAIVTPITPVTPGPNQPVSVTLKNFGNTAITTATIGWSVNGISQANYSWTGNLTNLQVSAPINIGNFTFPAGNFTLKAWSKLPNGTTDAVTANDTTILQVVSCAPLAGNYTIDKNNPTAGTNFQNFADVAQKLKTCGVSGPVTINVVAGTGPYNEQVELLNIPYTSATNTVTFEGNGNTVSANPWPKPGIFVLNGAKYVKLNNFVISLNASAGLGCGVQLLNAADYATISNNTINLPLTATTSAINGIIAGVDVSVVGNNTNHSKIQNNTINGGFYGIQINGNPTGLNTVNNQIIGNQIRNPYTYGIYLNNTQGTLVESNDISRATRENGTTLYNIYLAGSSINTVVNKNRMHNANDLSNDKTGALYGVYITAAATPGNENIIKNNIIYNLNGTNGFFYGFYNSGGDGAYYYHNTIVSNPAITYKTLRGIQFQSALTNVKFINNNISLPGTAIAKHAIYISTSGLALESKNNNLYVGSSGNIGHYIGLDFLTLTDWKTANNNAYEQNSVSTDPVFFNAAAGNLRPNTVTIDNLGMPLSTVTDDILGMARHGTTPDIGAFEFSIPANDVGIIAISTPNATGCSKSASETISVTIRNYGTNTQTSVPVSFSVNGVPMAATPETFTGSIAPNATVTYTFTAKANLANPGNFRIIAKTQLASDLATYNDADTMDLANPLVFGLPFTFDFETPGTGLAKFQQETRNKSNIVEHVTASSPFVTTSTKGIIMDGKTNSAWVIPTGITDPWTNNPDHFSAAYFCLNPGGGSATDSLWLTFDIRQLFKTTNANTNFRVTVNGVQVGPTYRPPFDPTNPATPNTWRKIKVNLFQFRNASSIKIALESSVSEEFANGNGTANLIDNVTIVRRIGTPTGVTENDLTTQLSVYPNPSNGLFNVNLPANKTFNLEVTDLTGKVILLQKTPGKTELKLQNLAKGIYLLKVSGENGSAVRKLIVE